KVETCPNIPNNTCKEGQQILMQKGGIEFTSISSDDKSGSPSPAMKRAKGLSGKAVVPKGAMESFIDRAMTVEEVNRANVRLLRFFVHGNVPLSASENPYFLKWTQSLQPSYSLGWSGPTQCVAGTCSSVLLHYICHLVFLEYAAAVCSNPVLFHSPCATSPYPSS
ncbi:hypothetical protein BDZ94DRAFT_1179705, partial [Collybia nuda]